MLDQLFVGRLELSLLYMSDLCSMELLPRNETICCSGGLVQPCNGECILDGSPCGSACPAGWTSCRAGWTYGQGDPYLDVCYDDSQVKLRNSKCMPYILIQNHSSVIVNNSRNV